MGTVALSNLLTTGTKTTFLAGGDSIVHNNVPLTSVILSIDHFTVSSY